MRGGGTTRTKLFARKKPIGETGRGCMVKCLFTTVRDLTIGKTKVDAGLENGCLARVTVDTDPGSGSRVVLTRGSWDGESTSN